jgi:hypothetical protein
MTSVAYLAKYLTKIEGRAQKYWHYRKLGLDIIVIHDIVELCI